MISRLPEDLFVLILSSAYVQNVMGQFCKLTLKGMILDLAELSQSVGTQSESTDDSLYYHKCVSPRNQFGKQYSLVLYNRCGTC